MALRRQKSKKSQVVDLLEDYLKLQAAKGTAVYKVAKKTPVVKRIPLIAGIAVAAAVVATKLRSSDDDGAAAAA